MARQVCLCPAGRGRPPPPRAPRPAPGLVPPPGMGAPALRPPPSGAAAPQATRHARRRIGSLPPSANEAATTGFFNQRFEPGGAAADQPGEPVLNTYFNAERFAFVGFAPSRRRPTARPGRRRDGRAEHSRAQAERLQCRRGRAAGTGAAVAVADLAAVGVTAPRPARRPPGASVPPEDQANRLFIGGLPISDRAHGQGAGRGVRATKSFKLVVDPDTGTARGTAFRVRGPLVTDVACQGLHGMNGGQDAHGEEGHGGEEDTGRATPPRRRRRFPEPTPRRCRRRRRRTSRRRAAGASAAARRRPIPRRTWCFCRTCSRSTSFATTASSRTSRRTCAMSAASSARWLRWRSRAAAPGDETPVPGLGKACSIRNRRGRGTARDALHGRKFG